MGGGGGGWEGDGGLHPLSLVNLEYLYTCKVLHRLYPQLSSKKKGSHKETLETRK
jgi:hypothetical protein